LRASPMPKFEEKIGVDRLGFNPHITAIAAWLSASGVDPTPREVDRFLLIHFEKWSTSEYYERFMAIQTGDREKASEGENPDSSRMLREAALEAEASLRKLVVATSTRGSFSDDSDFESDPVYSRAIDFIDEGEAAAADLARFHLARCPHCSLIGEVETWFGRRSVRSRKIRQSWCRVCRSIG
jgi:hypothetical protein